MKFIYLNVPIEDAVLTTGVILMGDRFKLFEELGIQKCKKFMGILYSNNTWEFLAMFLNYCNTKVLASVKHMVFPK